MSRVIGQHGKKKKKNGRGLHPLRDGTGEK